MTFLYNIYPILLLTASNVLMVFAWYGHLKMPHWPIWVAVLVAWGIAFFEYVLAVPANRLGINAYSLAELKAIQEILSIFVFMVVSMTFFEENLSWTQMAGFVIMALGAVLVFKGVKA